MSIREEITGWLLDKTTLSISPVIGKQSNYKSLYSEDALLVIRFHNEVDWKTDQLARAVTAMQAARKIQLFKTEAEAQQVRDQILESIPVDPILLFRVAKKEPITQAEVKVDTSKDDVIKVKRVRRKKVKSANKTS